jgi:hypothetical protein
VETPVTCDDATAELLTERRDAALESFDLIPWDFLPLGESEFWIPVPNHDLRFVDDKGNRCDVRAVAMVIRFEQTKDVVPFSAHTYADQQTGETIATVAAASFPAADSQLMLLQDRDGQPFIDIKLSA